MSQALTPDELNQRCACTTLDRGGLARELDKQLGGSAEMLSSNPIWRQLFSDSAVFVPEQDMTQMQKIVRAIETAASLPGYKRTVLNWAPASAYQDVGPNGVFMGYDFHLGAAGPQLIEINSNAGGAFLNATLARAQLRCCSGEVDAALTEGFDAAVVAMFESEWHAQGRTGRPARIAIVDENPSEQYLYPEFILAKTLLSNHGIETLICGPKELRYATNETGGGLTIDGKTVDMVYNRLVDFALDKPENEALRKAWLEGGAVITPNPSTHALFADKRNLAVLSDPRSLAEWGLDQELIDVLTKAIPATHLVSLVNAGELWQNRRQLFFKPVAGHGSKGVYRGSKLTKRVFDEVLHSDYIAQAFVPPSERVVSVDGERQRLKVDVRLYTYKGRVLLTAARLYRGQATNFRTPGGGFAPVFAL